MSSLDPEQQLTADGTMDLDQIIAALDEPGITELPVEAIRAAQCRRKEITSRLIELIRRATEVSRAGDVPASYGHFFALYLLTEFRAQEAWPEFLAVILLPDSGLWDLFGDFIAEEDLGRVLAVLGANNRDAIDELIANDDLDEFVRWQAARAYRLWVRDGQLSRAEAVERLRRQLKLACKNDDLESVNFLVVELLDYAAHEARDEIDEAFRLNLVDPYYASERDVESCMAEGESRFQEEMEDCRPTNVVDTVEELRWWTPDGDGVDIEPMADLWPEDIEPDDLLPDYELHQEPPVDDSGTIRNTIPRTGRNEPCPCGSGKKYKKCCGGR